MRVAAQPADVFTATYQQVYDRAVSNRAGFDAGARKGGRVTRGRV